MCEIGEARFGWIVTLWAAVACERFEPQELDSFGFQLDRFNPGPQFLRRCGRRGQRPRLQSSTNHAERAYNLVAPSSDTHNQLAELGTCHSVAANGSEPSSKEHDVNIAAVVILKGEASVGHPGRAIEIDRKIPESFARLRMCQAARRHCTPPLQAIVPLEERTTTQ
jgi:hypothetical protein